MKKYKFFKNYVELYLDNHIDTNLVVLVNLFKLFELNIGALLCTITYDIKDVDISIVDGEIEVKNRESQEKWVRIVKTNEVSFLVDSLQKFKSSFKISDDFDVMLTFRAVNTELNNIAVINDNGHDFIKWDDDKYNCRVIKNKTQEIFEN